MNGVQTGLKCKPNVKRCKRFVFAAHSPLLHPNTLTTKAISHFQADHILTRFVFPPLHPAAFELVYSDSSSPLPRKVKSIILGKSRIWYNTLWASLAGGHEDDQALKDPDGNYGYLIEELGARILQTDRPGFMLDYLRKKGLHD